MQDRLILECNKQLKTIIKILSLH